MTASGGGRRIGRLLRWYPKSWRARYGIEFAELLAADLAERPHSWRRTTNVAWNGTVARLTGLGLTSHPLEPSDQVRASLASLGCAVAVFLAVGAAMWSQLTIGWQWARPDTIGTTAAMVVMSGTMLVFVVLTVLAAAPLGAAVVRRIIRRRARGLMRPSLLLLVGAGLLIVGARHFGNGWPGTGGHPWGQQGLVPGGVAAFLWASTLSVSSYWAHPAILATFPGPELAWMVVSPVAMVGTVTGAVKIVRRLDVSSRVLRYERTLATVAIYAMAADLVGSCVWIVDGGPGPRNLFHAGAIDVAGLILMTTVSMIALRAVHRARNAGLSRLTP